MATGPSGPSSHAHAILSGAVLVGVTLLFGTLAIRRLTGGTRPKRKAKLPRTTPLLSEA
jgi:hypothetical protein